MIVIVMIEIAMIKIMIVMIEIMIVILIVRVLAGWYLVCYCVGGLAGVSSVNTGLQAHTLTVLPPPSSLQG